MPELHFRSCEVTPVGVVFLTFGRPALYWHESLRGCVGLRVLAADPRGEGHTSTADVVLLMPTIGAGTVILAAERLTDTAQLLPPAPSPEVAALAVAVLRTLQEGATGGTLSTHDALAALFPQGAPTVAQVNRVLRSQGYQAPRPDLPSTTPNPEQARGRGRRRGC